jgi:hypothetical protein
VPTTVHVLLVVKDWMFEAPPPPLVTPATSTYTSTSTDCPDPPAAVASALPMIWPAVGFVVDPVSWQSPATVEEICT